MKLRIVLAGLSACSALTIASVVWAAPRAPCVHARVTPAAASIPANLPAFGYTALNAQPSDVHLVATSGTKIEIPLTLGPVEGSFLRVAPTTPLIAGTTYELTFASFCGYGTTPPPGPLVFTATAEAPLPTKVGQIVSAPKFTVKDFGTTQYTIAASYTLDPEMKPWASVYQLNVVFDGRAVETKVVPAGDGIEVAATGWCDQATAATKKHTVQLRGKLAFAPTIETASSELEFDCPAPNIGTPTSNPVPPEPGGGSSSGTGNGTGAGNGAGNGNGSSGGCSVTGASTSSLPALAALFGLAALLRRRKSS